MPINAKPEFFKAQEKFLSAKSREEKIAALEEMIALAPKHKGAEKLLAQLRTKLAKLRAEEEREQKRGGKFVSVAKEGDAQVCLVGFTQSGKSTILSMLTNKKVAISNVPYTTKAPEVGTMEYGGVKIQIVEIPSTLKNVYVSIARNADGVVYVLDGSKDVAKQRFDLEQIVRSKKPSIVVVTKISQLDPEELKEKIWKMLGMIRIYTKEPGREPESHPLVLKNGATVRDVANRLHKDFVKFFKFARVWGASVKFQGEKVGLDHELKDKDIIEIHC
jgi:small GTP-binding protein